MNKKRQRLTLPRFTAVPSAQVVLTSLFGMGRGDPHRYSHPKNVVIFSVWIFDPHRPDNYRDHLKILDSLAIDLESFYHGLSTNCYGLSQYR